MKLKNAGNLRNRWCSLLRKHRLIGRAEHQGRSLVSPGEAVESKGICYS